MTNFTPELVEKAKAAQTADELLEIAKAAGVEMTAAEAATYFAQLNPKSGELDDDDLDNVAGGACDRNDPNLYAQDGDRVRVITGETCPKCGGTVGHVWLYCGGHVECESCPKTLIASFTNENLQWGVEIERA